MGRICSLPSAPSDLGQARWLDGLHRPEGTMQLNHTQRCALDTLRRWRCLVGLIGVGQGKTLITALAPKALDIPGCACLLLLPPSMLAAFDREVDKYLKHFHIDAPEPLSYGLLSTRPHELEVRAPRVIIADEAHCLRDHDSGRTRRLSRYLADNPETIFIPMSGTLLNHSLMGIGHLFTRALDAMSPLPRAWNTLTALDLCTRVPDGRGGPSDHDWSQVRHLSQWAGEAHTVDGLRAAVHRRIATAPGVVTTSTGSAAQTLMWSEDRTPPPRAIKDALRQLRSTWMLPDGTALVDPMRLAEAAKQLALGFFYTWDWGAAGPNLDWLRARATFAQELTRWLKHSGRRLAVDTPGMVQAILRSGTSWLELPDALRDAWDAWVEIEPEADPQTVPVWLDDTALRRAAAWAQEHRALVWYTHRAVAAQLATLGVEVAPLGGVPDGPERALAVSVQSHGTGKNLQTWSRNLVLTPSSSAQTWEQLVGRTHRQGQLADDVVVRVMAGTGELRDCIRKARADARYLAGMTGQEQKLLLFVDIDEDAC